MSNKLDKILAEISAGELIDKITILEIKKSKITDKNKLIHIDKELSSLNILSIFINFYHLCNKNHCSQKKL